MAVSEIASVLKIVEGIVKLAPIVNFLIDNKYRKYSYYFKYYNKSVKVYCNGNGLIKNEFVVRIINPTKFKTFKRLLNVEDGKKDIEFPPLEVMMHAPECNRFQNYGFWCHSDEGIISSCKEFYWDDDLPDDEENIALKTNKKELRWIFDVDTNKLKKHKDYCFAFYISVPGLFPIKEGLYDFDSANIKIERPNRRICSSSITVNQYVRKIDFSLSLEKGIDVEVNPTCNIVRRSGEGNKVHTATGGLHSSDFFYNRWNFDIKKPALNDDIVIEWKVNENARLQTRNQNLISNYKK